MHAFFPCINALDFLFRYFHLYSVWLTNTIICVMFTASSPSCINSWVLSVCLFLYSLFHTHDTWTGSRQEYQDILISFFPFSYTWSGSRQEYQDILTAKFAFGFRCLLSYFRVINICMGIFFSHIFYDVDHSFFSSYKKLIEIVFALTGGLKKAVLS